MRISYTLTQSDWEEAAQLHYKKKQRLMRWLTQIISVVAFWGLAHTWMSEGPSIKGIYLFLAVLVAGIFQFLYRIEKTRWEKFYRKNKGLRGPATVVISEKTSKRYSNCLESGNLFLLYRDLSTFDLIPKRAFSVAELEQFRELLQKKSA